LHRDITSQNILLAERGIVKLAGFGLARVLSPSGAMAKTVVGNP